jgi:hypothetical protein
MYISGATRGTFPTMDSISIIVLQTSEMGAGLNVVNIYSSCQFLWNTGQYVAVLDLYLSSYLMVLLHLNHLWGCTFITQWCDFISIRKLLDSVSTICCEPNLPYCEFHLNTWDCSFIRLPSQCMTYSQRCCRSTFWTIKARHVNLCMEIGDGHVYRLCISFLNLCNIH